MLRRWSVRDVLGPQGVAARVIPAWEARESQIKMAEATLERLELGGSLVVEAPTGVGKTLAYLVPAVLSGRKVLVSTNTKTLQDQIIDKDLPRLKAIFKALGLRLERAEAGAEPEPGVVRYALMKGRSNYLCWDRLDRRTRQRGFEFEAGLVPKIRTWAETSRYGDRAELPWLPERSPLWDELDARSEICHGSRCPRWDDCFVLRMRQEAAAADIIIVNHHLLLADLALRAESAMVEGRSFGSVLPEAEALVVDEAHALEEVASTYFGGEVSSRKLERLAKDIMAFLTGGAGRGGEELLLTRVVAATEAVFAELPNVEGRIRIPGATDKEADLFAAARDTLSEATLALKNLELKLSALVDQEPNAEVLARRCRELAESLKFVLGAEDPDFVHWMERQGKVVALGASPIQVSGLLGRHLFDSFGAVVLASATLAAGDVACRYFLSSVGAPRDTDVLVLDSPYDFEAQAALYLPDSAPDPTDHRACDRLADEAELLIERMGGGALFLFTSYRAMHAVHGQLSGRLRFPMLIQGQQPKRELLRAFVERAPAVLFGTASFWEGVDIPGDPLRLVLIDRLPFDPPNDPLIAARSQRLEAAGKSAFSSLLVPRAILRLQQGFGRLVRTRDDRGVVAVLDRRIKSKAYGQRFLRALPGTPQFTQIDALSAWWERPQNAPKPPKIKR